MHVLEVSGVTAPRGSAATVDRPATDAATSVGSGERAAALRHPGHRYHRAHAVWPADGSPQGLQPEEQREEKLPADSDFYRGNARVRRGRVTQWRSAKRAANCTPSGECLRRPADFGDHDLRPGGF